jgi:small-conductance mechanosensitive channel
MDLSYFTDYHLVVRDAIQIWKGLDSKTISTVVLILTALLIRSISVAWLEKNTDMAPHVLVQWKQRLYRFTLLLIVILIAVIWAPELRTFAVTLVAVAAAIVLAFKEVITCFTGSIIRATVEGAHIGGRILVTGPYGGVHGDVAATDLMSTTILEVNDYGQRTGRTIVLPNSFFIGNPTITEAAADRKYILMMVDIPVNRTEDWELIEKTLYVVGNQITEPYIKEAKKHFARFNRRFGFNAPGPEPKILIDWNDPDRITMKLRIAVPVTEQNAKRQEILRTVLNALKTKAVEEKITSAN